MTGGVEITLRDVYDAQKQTDGKVEHLGAQLSAHAAAVEAKLESGQNKMNDHESRIRALERFRFTIAGAAIAGGTLAATVAAIIEYAITRK